MRDLGALAYLEWRQIVNRLKGVMSSPGRSLFYVLLVGYFIFTAMVRARRMHGTPSLPEPYASATFFAFITLLGVGAYGAASGFSGVFSSPADARFLAGSRIDERLVVMWLQLRRSASAMTRTVLSLVLYVVLVSHSRQSASIALTILGATSMVSAVSVPLLKFRNLAGARVAKALSGAVAAIGILPLLILLSGLFSPSATQLGIEHLGTGTFVNALLSGNVPDLAAVWGVSIALVVVAWVTGDDLYPELYSASLRTLAFRRRSRAGAGAAFTVEHKYNARRSTGLLSRWFDRFGGAWAIAWKEWIAFTRSGGMRRLFWFGLIAASVVGAVIGAFAMSSPHPLETSAEFVPTLFFVFVIFVTMGAAISLRDDIGKPLWWIGADSLQKRLFAWVCGTSWRMATVVFAAIAAWAFAMHRIDWALCAIPTAAIVVGYMRAAGLAIYAMFPATVDQRGPMGAVRALLTYALGAPPMIVCIVTAVLWTQNVLILLGLGCAIAAAEIYALIAFTAWRIAGRGFAFATAEAA